MPEMHYRTGLQSADDPLLFRMTDATIDRMGERVLPSGADLKEFRKNPMALWGHSSDFPIGTWQDIKKTATEITGRLKFAAKGSSPIIDELRTLVEQRVLRAVSIGFMSDKAGPADDDPKIFEHKKWTLLECSLVSIPANPNALAIVKSKLSPEATRVLFGDPAADPVALPLPGDPATAPKKSRNPARVPTRCRKGKTMAKTNAERIVEAEELIDENKAAITEITELAATEERDLTDVEQIEIDEHSQIIEEKTASLTSMKRAEKVLALKEVNRSQARDAARVQGQLLQTAGEDKPGELFFKVAACKVVSHQKRMTMEEVQKSLYPSDNRIETLVKAATTEATTGGSGWADTLVDSSLAGFLDVLKPESIWGPLASMGTSIPFGRNGTVVVPKRTAAGTVPGSFVGENVPIPVKQDAYSSTTLSRFKMGVISMFTRELAEQSTPAIEGLLRSAMISDTAAALDAALLDGAAASAGVRPASILNGVTGTASAGDTTDNIVTDLKVLFAAMAALNAGQNLAIIMNSARKIGLMSAMSAGGDFLFRDEVNQGRLMGARLIVSNTCPAQQVIIVDAAHFATAFGTPDIRVDDVATVVMADDDGVAPDMPIRVDEAAGTTPATQVHSMFQQASTGIRLIMPLSWAMMRPTIDQITSATW